MAWTDKQKDAIESRNESLLVSAAAGSGKTSVLVERVIRLVKEGTPLNRMLVVTFTNAAAAEMKERISAISGPAALRHSHISTFHKFAMDVIRRYYHIIGADPGFTICDEYKQSILAGEAMDEMFEDMFEKDDALFTDFLNCYASAKSDRAARELILEFSRFLESLPDPEDFCRKTADGSIYNIESYSSYAALEACYALERAISFTGLVIDLLNNPPAPAHPMPKLAAKAVDDLEQLKLVLSHLKKEAYGVSAFSEITDFKFSVFRASKDEKNDYELIKDTVTDRRDAAKNELKAVGAFTENLSPEYLEKEKDMLKKPLSELVYLTREFRKRYGEKKKSGKLMDFSDIEHNALKILENETVCEELRNSFDCIFVDEYQDSNLVQEELISRIARANNLFMVGDVKQSIYKFRLAEPDIFLEKYYRFKNGYAADSRVIDLNSNFRSKSPVIGIVNKVFSSLMKKDSVGIDYDEDAALREGNPYTGAYLYTPKLYLVSSEYAGECDDAVEELKDVELEALESVRIIKEWHGKTIHDSKKNIDRPLDYRDMVILMRSVKNRGEVFYKTLENAGIPVFLERSEGYFDTPEIEVTLNLLRIIDNFSQDVPLISVLHFPVFGFTADELADIRISANKKGAHKRAYYRIFREYAKGGENLPLREKTSAFLNSVERWRKMEEAMPLADFIWDLLIESGISGFCRALPAGEQRLANLRALVDKVRNFEAQSASGLFGFINYVETVTKKGKVETGQAAMLGEGVDAVRIMTIHKSKGLEFPFVLLAGMGSRLNGRSDSSGLSIHKDLGVSIKIAEPIKSLVYSPIASGLIKIQKDRDELAENIRILYVAFTRAKDILVMSGVVKNASEYIRSDKSIVSINPASAKNYLDMVAPSLDFSQFVPVCREDIELDRFVSDAESSSVLEALDRGFAVDESLLPLPAEEIRQRLEFNYEPEADSLRKTKYSVSELAALAREKREETDAEKKKTYRSSRRAPNFVKECGLDAASVGTAYHTVMEHIPFTAEGKSVSEVADFIKGLREKNLLSEAEATAVAPEKIAAFFESDIGKRACASSEIHRESPFVMKTFFEGRSVFVQGTIDCWFKEGDGCVLVDYKNSYVNPSDPEAEKERLRENYLTQLALYREAMEKILNRKVKEAVLYLFGTGDCVRV